MARESQGMPFSHNFAFTAEGSKFPCNKRLGNIETLLTISLKIMDSCHFVKIVRCHKLTGGMITYINHHQCRLYPSVTPQSTGQVSASLIMYKPRHLSLYHSPFTVKVPIFRTLRSFSSMLLANLSDCDLVMYATQTAD